MSPRLVSRRRSLALLAQAAALLASPLGLSRSPAAAVTWAVNSDGTWSVASNWSSSPALPGPADAVTISRPAGDFLVTLDAGSQSINSLTADERLLITGGTLTLATDSTLNNTLTLDGGTIAGSGPLTLNGSFTFSSGTLTALSAPTDTAVLGSLTITGGSAKTFSRRTITNSSSTTWSAGQMNTGFLASFVNASGANFTTSFDGSWIYNLGGGSSTFTNQGTFTKSAGSGVTLFTSVFNNSGTVNVNSGTLQLAASSTHSGTFSLAPAATLDFSAGTHLLDSGTSFTGSGTLALTGATLTATSPLTVAAPFSLTGGTFNGTATATFTAPVTWSSGAFAGTGTSDLNAGLSFSTTATKTLSQRTLVNNASTTWAAGQLNTGFQAEFVNAPGATFDNSFDGNWLYNLGGGVTTFTNQGTFTKSAGSAATLFSSVFNNTGTVKVNSGTLQLAAGGTNSSSIVLAANTTLNVSAGTYTLSAGTTLTGPASSALSVTGGTLTVSSPLTLSAPLSLAGGIVNGATALTLASPATWSSGAFSGTGSTTFAAGLTFDTNSVKTLSQRTLVNASTTTWSAGQLNTGALANFINPPGSTFNNSFDGNWLYNLGGGTSTFTNQGTFTKSAGAGTTTISSVFNNTGTVSLSTGTLALSSGSSSGAFAVAAPAVLEFSASTFDLDSGATLSGAGTVTLSNATLNVNAPLTVTVAAFNYAGGVLTGAGDLTHSMPVTWTGTSLTGPGAIIFNAPLSLSSNTTKTFRQRTLTNHSAVTWSGGQVNTGSLATFVNAPGATFTTDFDGSWLYDLGGGASTFDNRGTFTKSAGAGTTTLSPVFLNTGAVVVSTGTLALAGTSTLSGSITVAAPATLEFTSAVHSLDSGVNLTGPGAADLENATLTANAAVSLSVATFNFNRGTQNGDGALTLTGTVNWDQTLFNGAGSTTFNGPLHINTSSTRTLSQRALTAAASATWSAGQVNTGALASFVVAPSATFDNSFDGSWLSNLGGGGTTFTNQGTFTKSAGAGTTTFTASFSNTGTVNVNSGTLSLSSVAQHVGNTLTQGAWNVNNSTLLFPTGVDILTIGPAASVSLSGPSSVFARVNPVATVQGAFTVTSGRNFTTAGALTNSGNLTVGLLSNFNISGNFDNPGTLVVLSGSVAATSISQLSGTTLTGGTWKSSNGVLSFAAGSDIATIGPAANVLLAGPLASFPKVNALSTNQGRFTVADGRNFTTVGPFTNTGTLTVGASSAFKVTGALSNSGAVDLYTGSLLLDYTGPSPVATLRTQLLTGRASGAWTGPGVRSTAAAADPQHLTAIAYAEASDLLGLTGPATSTYAGLPVDATTLLTKYTYYGDSNFDGKVDADDLARIDRGLAKGLTGWLNGDFNYDNTINAADYLLIDRSLFLQGCPLASPSLLHQRESQFGPAYVSDLLATLPEPSPFLLLATNYWLLATRFTRPRRRR